MTKAYVLITTEVGKIEEVQSQLRNAGISQIDAVAGIYDLIAIVEADDPKQIGQTVMNQIQRAEGVLSTVTLLQVG